ncbi:hypothetical protein [Yinghuangia seranimata]|uniref:hypothetical protein n=1 Tax=Yinghuangia seranimata TaxID=408067 RepID=UPI00248A9F1E|nr:hypothetical protein [Yinghuangia seranimata]MDI2125941.1 hypothetical protein [Yinghuangia seranimata]
MMQYQLFQARQQELHRDAQHERVVTLALRGRRAARRTQRAEVDSDARVAGGLARATSRAA